MGGVLFWEIKMFVVIEIELRISTFYGTNFGICKNSVSKSVKLNWNDILKRWVCFSVTRMENNIYYRRFLYLETLIIKVCLNDING